MIQKKTNIYTDGTYANSHPDYHVRDSAWKANNILKILSKNNLSPENICEVGRGAGDIIKTISDKNPNNIDCYGYEISPQAFELCKTRETNRLKFFLKDILEEENTLFDLLLCIDVFEHVDDYLGFIRGLKDKSKYKIFHIPLDVSIQSVFRETPIIKARKETGHLHYFTKHTAIETLKYCGYTIKDSFYTRGSIERGSGTLLNNLGRIPRKVLFKINQDFAVKLMGGFSLMVLAE